MSTTNRCLCSVVNDFVELHQNCVTHMKPCAVSYTKGNQVISCPICGCFELLPPEMPVNEDGFEDDWDWECSCGRPLDPTVDH